MEPWGSAEQFEKHRSKPCEMYTCSSDEAITQSGRDTLLTFFCLLLEGFIIVIVLGLDLFMYCVIPLFSLDL
jgi:hypothetical protein